MAMGKSPQSPHEEIGGSGGTIDAQFRIARASLNYTNRFQPQPSSPSSTNGDTERWQNADRASGRK